MAHINGTEGKIDPFRLARFTTGQESSYANAISELTQGKKRTHWMWYIFPQIAGLGYSATSKHYAISGLEEAKAYLDHPVLGARLRQCAEAVLGVEGCTASQIFGSPDDVKLQSSMTLFSKADRKGSVFTGVLDKYFEGKEDEATLRKLGLSIPPPE